MRRLCLSLALCAALIATGCATPGNNGGSGPSSEDAGGAVDAPREGPRPTEPAPDFAVTTFEGDRFALGEQRGTPVVLNFWESW